MSEPTTYHLARFSAGSASWLPVSPSNPDVNDFADVARASLVFADLCLQEGAPKPYVRRGDTALNDGMVTIIVHTPDGNKRPITRHQLCRTIELIRRRTEKIIGT